MSRIDALIGEMTLAEKLGQLTMTAAGHAVTGPTVAGHSTEAIKAGTVGNLLNLIGAQHARELQRLALESRLGIPLIIGLDVLHGHRTLFPIPLAEAGLFDPQTWELTARESAAEAAADGIAMTFAPMLDVARDPRWGRSAEGPGEDPWLAARIAEAKVRGFQGAELAAGDALAAVAKHFCAYGAVTAGREYAAVDVSERTVLEVHLPPFAAAVAAGVAAVMPAFTDLAGVPMTANAALLRGWLRERLGFDGVIVSDYNAIAELIRHGVAADLPQAAALALRAGVDIDMMADAYRRGLPQALERELVGMQDIDAAVRRVLTLKERLGLFTDPYRRGGTPQSSEAIARRRALARTVAARSLVLLRNERDTLPLSATTSCLALLGPLADAAAEMGGPWRAAAAAADCASVLAGLREALPAASILHAPGVDLQGGDDRGIAEATALIEPAEAVVLCLGEGADMSGEAASRAHLGLPGRQQALAQAVLERAGRLGRPVVAVLFSGRALIVPWLMERADAVLAAWFPGCQAGHAIADVLTGRTSPSGRTPVSWPRAIGQIPLFYGQRPSGRAADARDPYTSKYLDESNEPLFPFGHGLSYTRFSLTDLRVRAASASEADTIEIDVQVHNEGAREAEETVLLFVRDPLASVTRPLLELKGFGKVRLQAGERTRLALRLAASELRFPGADLQPRFEAGELEILVGPCADRARLLCARLLLRP